MQSCPFKHDDSFRCVCVFFFLLSFRSFRIVCWVINLMFDFVDVDVVLRFAGSVIWHTSISVHEVEMLWSRLKWWIWSAINEANGTQNHTNTWSQRFNRSAPTKRHPPQKWRNRSSLTLLMLICFHIVPSHFYEANKFRRYDTVLFDCIIR